MTNERIKELYDNMLNHISELVSRNDLVDTLRAIGFTDEEIVKEGFKIENEHCTECPLGGDITDDCADCVYSCDYHFVNGECTRRKEETNNENLPNEQ